MPQPQKDYSTISPSAKSLLLMKGYTNIPYAKETAALMQGPEIFNLDFNNKDFWFWIRVMHFEGRYWSIDQLMKLTDNRNILELSSGYSLRGLDLCAHNESIHYIDTDLPDVIDVKKDMISQLHLDTGVKGNMELLPLNALDEQAFHDIVQRFDKGPITIVNEGLLMYLNTEEKQSLCRMIHSVLKERGGCWITADIYLKLPETMQMQMPKSSSEANFLAQHNLEENKFDSYETAETFFKSQGFELVKEAEQNFDSLSSLPYLIKTLPEEMRKSKNPPPKIQATWMLKAV